MNTVKVRNLELGNGIPAICIPNVGKTKEEYKKEELLYFNNVNMIVVFYLINEEVNKIYMNDSWVFTLGLNYKKYIRKINEIMTQ